MSISTSELSAPAGQLASSDDETAWLQQLYSHVNCYLAPLITKASSRELHEGVLQALQAATSTLPVEYDILTVQILLDRFRNSFRVDLHPHHNTEPQEVSEWQCSPIPRLISRLLQWIIIISNHSQNRGTLPVVPAVLLGVLGVSGQDSSHGELVLKDSTGNIICEVCCSNVPLHCVESAVLLKTWNFIYSRNRSYLEVQELCPLLGCTPSTIPLPTQHNLLAVDEIQTHLKRKIGGKRARITVYGRVTAVSQVHRNGPDNYLLLLQVSNIQTYHTCSIVVQSVRLMHLALVIKISEVYIFSELRDMVMNKGSPNERRVLATSDTTQVHPYSNSIDVCPPPRKREKTNGTERSTELELSGGDSQESKCGDVVSMRPTTSPLVSYKGTVTKCILSDAGVYELDGRVRLYLTHCECLDMCRGVRCGSVMELHNMHVMKLSGTPWKHASGFYCCSLSTARVVQFSKSVSPFKPFIGRNKLAGLLRRYQAMDAAWLVEAYLSLLQKDDRHDARVCYPFLEELCKLAGMSAFSRDINTICAEFLSHEQCCHLLQHVDLTDRPEVPPLGDFMQSVKEVISAAQFQWLGHQQDSTTHSSFWTFAVSAQWSFGSVRSSDLQHPQILVGYLQGNKQTGGMELSDSTGSVPVVYSITLDNKGKQQGCPVVHLGCKVLINQATVYVEKTAEGQSAPHIAIYVYVNEITLVLETPRKASSENQGSSVHSPESDEAENTGRLYFVAISKNALVVEPSTSSLSFTMQAQVHTNLNILKSSSQSESSESLQQKQEQHKSITSPARIALVFPSGTVQWYSYISVGCLYSLSAASKRLPSLKSLQNEPCITVEDSMEINFVQSVAGSIHCCQPVLDVADVISKLFLPRFSTVSTVKSSGRTEQQLVSFKGVIVKHGYRISHEILPVSETASSLGATPSVGQPSCSQIIALTIQSLNFPDTIMVYCSYKQGIPLPLGLLPGSVATMHGFKLMSSKSGNIYCMNCASSSIDVNSVKSVDIDTEKSLKGVPPEMSAVPTVCLGHLMDTLLHGCLSRRVVCVQGIFVSVQHACLQFKCQGCQCTSIDGNCMPTCLQKKPILKAEARLILGDGTGEGHMYISDHLVPEAMGIPGCDWSELCDLVRQVGQVVYNKPLTTLHQLQGGSTQKLSVQERAQQMLVTLPSLHRRMKIYCQPFVSSAELKESVIGQKFHTVRLGTVTEYVTLALPRLQLRALALAPVNYTAESATLLESLMND